LKQQDLEREMSDLGTSRYWKKVNRYKEMEMETSTSVGRRLLGNALGEMEKALEKWKKEASERPGPKHRALNHLESLPNKVIAAIACKSILDSVSHAVKFTRASMKLGRLIEDEVLFRDIQENEPALWNHINEVLNKFTGYQKKTKFIKKTAKFNNLVFDRWASMDRANVGMVLIELFKQSTGLIEIITRRGMLNKQETLVKATDSLKEWLKKAYQHQEDIFPVYMPMIEKPCNWNSLYWGGYSSDVFYRKPMIKVSDRKFLKNIEDTPMPEVYSCINSIQRTGWHINKPVLDVMKELWESGSSLGNLPSTAEVQLPNKPIDMDTNEEARKDWRRAAAKIRFENEAEESKRLQMSRTLFLANKFKNETIYFPHQYDFRGRIYPVPAFLHYQNTDWSAGLLTFAEGKPLTDESHVQWLAIHGANCFGDGLDKKPFEERIQWVLDNEEFINDCHRHPFGQKGWGGADKPYQFLAFCDEWVNHKKLGSKFISRLPISQDGSNNGLQVLSMALRDTSGCLATNCLPSKLPRDVYNEVNEKVLQKLRDDKTNAYASMWLKCPLSRATVKRPVMVVPYSGTKYSCKNYIIDWYKDMLKKNPDFVTPFGEELYQPCSYLADIVWESIGEVVVAARVLMNWFRDVAAICVKNKVSIQWTTPVGFPVKQAYPNFTRHSVRTSIGDVIRQHPIRMAKESLSLRKNVNGLSPNWTHSIDAAMMIRTVNLGVANSINSFAMTHDEYATVAADSPMMASVLRTAAKDIFSIDLLVDFYNQISILLPAGVSLPAPPLKGNADVTQVLESDYFFS
jgi:DNA-directed RNA polymerase